MSYTEHAGTGLADQGEHFGENGVQILFPVLRLFPINGQTLRQFLIHKGLHFGLKRIDLNHQQPEFFQKTIVLIAESLAYEGTYYENSRRRGCTASTTSPN